MHLVDANEPDWQDSTYVLRGNTNRNAEYKVVTRPVKEVTATLPVDDDDDTEGPETTGDAVECER